MTFSPRAERLNLSFPVEFRLGKDITRGSCLNISESGMLAQFHTSLDVWTEGDLWADAGITTLLIHVRIMRVMDHQVGLTFRFLDDAQRDKVRSIVVYATRNTHLAGGAPPF